MNTWFYKNRPFLVVIYLFGAVLSWGHFISRGCLENFQGECASATERSILGAPIVFVWPVYAASIAFETEQKP